MNRNGHLRYKPIIETRPFLGGIVVSARCPKCKSMNKCSSLNVNAVVASDGIMNIRGG